MNYVKNESDQMIIGWRAIGTLLGVAPVTAQRWDKRHGLPVARLPDGRVATSRSLIDQWLLARRDAQRPDTGTAGQYVDSSQSVDN